MNKTSLSFLLLLALLPIFQTHGTRCVHDEKKKHAIIPHPELEETDGRVLLSSDWESIRIVPFYYVDNASARIQARIQEQLIPAVIAYYKAALKVKRLTQKIAMPDYFTYHCAEVYSNSALRSGVNADLVLLITGSSEPDQPYIAYAQACSIETTGNRPITGMINFNYYYGFSSNSDINYQSQIYTTLHELGHVLGFSEGLYEYFVDPDTLIQLPNPTMTKPVNGKSITILTLDPLTDRLRDYFACYTLEGAYIEQQGGDGSAGSHFERRIFLNEFMTASDITDPRVSEFFLALLEGTGWYSPDYSMAEPMFWGKGQGCEFLEEKCIDSGSTDFPGYFCDTLAADSCSFGNQAYGFCGTTDPSEKDTTMDTAYNYWGDFTVIYDSFSDNCPYYISYSGTECRDESNDAINLPNGEIFGEKSSCFTGTLGNFVAKTSDEPFCFKKYCEEVTTGQYQVIVTVGEINITCTSAASVAVTGFQGVLNCPDPNTFCTTSALAYCPRGCTGRGTCENNQCVCRDGYYGIDCGYQTITPAEEKKKITAIIIGAVVGGLVVAGVAGFIFFKIRAKKLRARRVSTLENQQQPNGNQSAMGMSSFQPIQANSQFYYPNNQMNFGSNPGTQRGQPVWYNGSG